MQVVIDQSCLPIYSLPISLTLPIYGLSISCLPLCYVILLHTTQWQYKHGVCTQQKSVIIIINVSMTGNNMHQKKTQTLPLMPIHRFEEQKGRQGKLKTLHTETSDNNEFNSSWQQYLTPLPLRMAKCNCLNLPHLHTTYDIIIPYSSKVI